MSSPRDGINVALQEPVMNLIGDTSKARLIALFIDHLLAFSVMMVTLALVPESLPSLKAFLFIFVYWI